MSKVEENNAPGGDGFLEQSRSALARLEQIRLKNLKDFERRSKIALPVGAILVPLFAFIDFFLLSLQSGSDDQFAGLSVIGLGGLWWWANQPKRAYAAAYKKDILPKIANLFGDFRYEPKGGISMDQMKLSKIVPRHNKFATEDHFIGNYKNVSIEFSEIKLKRSSRRSTVTVFDGLAILLTRGTRKFYGHTILVKETHSIGEWFKSVTSGLQKADLVDPEFERLFDVFTTDQVEARYLLDPAIMENLKSLYEEHDGERLMAAFYEGSVLILVESKKNLFEPASIHTPATDSESILSMRREVSSILSIIDRLSLIDRRNKQSG